MSRAVQERRDALWNLLHENPEDGLTREEVAERMEMKSATVKTDLKQLHADGRVQLRQGGPVEGGPKGSYRRAWFATTPNKGTPLYDALALAIENGAEITLTAELLLKLRADLRG